MLAGVGVHGDCVGDLNGWDVMLCLVCVRRFVLVILVVLCGCVPLSKICVIVCTSPPRSFVRSLFNTTRAHYHQVPPRPDRKDSPSKGGAVAETEDCNTHGMPAAHGASVPPWHEDVLEPGQPTALLQLAPPRRKQRATLQSHGLRNADVSRSSTRMENWSSVRWAPRHAPSRPPPAARHAARRPTHPS